MVAEIVPAAVSENVPIVTGLAKLPEALLNWAEYVFPGLNAPVFVKGTLTAAPAQKVEPEREEVVMLFWANRLPQIIINSEISRFFFMLFLVFKFKIN